MKFKLGGQEFNMPKSSFLHLREKNKYNDEDPDVCSLVLAQSDMDTSGSARLSNRMIFRQMSSVRKLALSLRVVSRKNPGDFRTIRGGALSKLQQNDEERNQMQEYLALEQESRSQFKPITEEDESRELGPTEQDDGYGKLHTKMLSKTSKYLSMITVDNIDQNALLVRAGSSGGIYTIKGDAFMTKDLVLSWKAPEQIDNIRIENFIPALMLHPKTSLIVLGTGDTMERVNPELIAECNKRGIGIEISNSYRAVGLYNLLCAERDGEGVALFVKAINEEREVFEITRKERTQADVLDRTRVQITQNKMKRGSKVLNPKK